MARSGKSMDRSDKRTTGGSAAVTQIDGAGAGSRSISINALCEGNVIFGATTFGAAGVHFQNHWTADAEL